MAPDDTPVTNTRLVSVVYRCCTYRTIDTMLVGSLAPPWSSASAELTSKQLPLRLAYGYIVNRTGSYDAPFVPMAAALLIGALLWLKVDASTELSGVHRDAA